MGPWRARDQDVERHQEEKAAALKLMSRVLFANHKQDLSPSVNFLIGKPVLDLWMDAYPLGNCNLDVESKP